MKTTERDALLEARDQLFLLTKGNRVKTIGAFRKLDKVLGTTICTTCEGLGVSKGKILESGPCNSDWKYEIEPCVNCLGTGRKR